MMGKCMDGLFGDDAQPKRLASQTILSSTTHRMCVDSLTVSVVDIECQCISVPAISWISMPEFAFSILVNSPRTSAHDLNQYHCRLLLPSRITSGCSQVNRRGGNLWVIAALRDQTTAVQLLRHARCVVARRMSSTDLIDGRGMDITMKCSLT